MVGLEMNNKVEIWQGQPAQESAEKINEKISGKFGTLYKSTGNLFIIRDCFNGVPKQFEDTSRSEISEFSLGSANRMRRYLRECLSDYANMVTLTYPAFFPSNGKTVKEHLRRFLQELKRYTAKRNMSEERYSVFWFIEFQERGAPHFHLFTTHSYPKDWVSHVWYNIVKSDDLRHLSAGTRCEALRKSRAGLISYACKYAVKQVQKAVPEGYANVGRFWGVSGYRAVVSAATFVIQDEVTRARTSGAIFMLIQETNKLLFRGECELYKREQGTAVFIVESDNARLKLRARINQLAAITQKIDSMFNDAEVDNGELFEAISIALGNLANDSPGYTIDVLEKLCKENRLKYKVGVGDGG
jgi:hypothetical protein